MPLAIHRYEIPVDNQWHTLFLSGDLLHVAARRSDTVELWAFSDGSTGSTCTFRVFGTGQPLPDDATIAYRGTALAPGGLVWHLMELHP
jgi:hypothetical protein